MALFTHKGGSLQVWNKDGSKAEILHYGSDLDKACPECKSPAFSLCKTASGNKLGKTHKARK